MNSDVKSAGPGESISMDLEHGTPTVFRNNRPLKCKRQVTAACDSSPGIASLELRLI